jgi:hypothetical protein
MIAILGTSFMSETALCQQPKTDFQIRIDVYTDESRRPDASLLTIFTSKLYIELDDLDNQKGKCTVVDPGKGRITLLNRDKKNLVHLEMNAIKHQLARAMEVMSQEELARFQTDGSVTQEADGYFSIGNSNIRYVYLPIPAKAEIATSYSDFTSWICRVNAVHPPKIPPQIRLQLNELLADQSQLPSVIKRQIKYSNKTTELVARLNLTESLSNADRSRVANVFQWMQEFSPVSENEFFK